MFVLARSGNRAIKDLENTKVRLSPDPVFFLGFIRYNVWDFKNPLRNVGGVAGQTSHVVTHPFTADTHTPFNLYYNSQMLGFAQLLAIAVLVCWGF